MAKPRPRALDGDPLKASLDQLAEKLVKKAMDDGEATVRTLSDALKVAGAYWNLSRKDDGKDAPPDAWAAYQSAFMKGEPDAPPN
jgi:hypothetical protein